MRRLDRHLLTGFLVTALISGAAVFCLFVLVDCFQHFDAFLKSSQDRGQSIGRVIASFYLHQLPLMASFLAPAVACAAAGAAATRLQRDHETVVLKSSGVSLQRAGLPLLAGAALLGALMAADQELLIPRVARTVAANEKASLGHDEQGNRLVSFGASLLVVFCVYYPAMVAGKELSLSGRLPVGVGLWMPDLLMLGTGAFLVRALRV